MYTLLIVVAIISAASIVVYLLRRKEDIKNETASIEPTPDNVSPIVTPTVSEATAPASGSLEYSK